MVNFFHYFTYFLEGHDGTSTVIEDFNMEKTLEFIEEHNKENDQKLRLVHVMTHCAAWGLYKMRKDVGRNFLGGFKHYTSSKQKQILITSFIDVDNLTVPLTFGDVHKLSLVEFAKIYDELENRARTKKDLPW